MRENGINLRSVALVLLTVFPVTSLCADFMSAAMSPAELGTRLESGQAPLIVDLRKPAEFRIAHVPGAKNIPLDKLEDNLGTLKQSSAVLIYCINGARTRQAEPVLYAAGIEHVYHLEGAFQGWIQSGLDYEKGESP